MKPVMNGSLDLKGSVRGERRHDDVTADFLALVPRSVASNEDRVVVFLREHLSGVEAHTERCAVRPELRYRFGELVAAMPPAELRVGNVAAVAIRKAEIVLARMEQAVELVVRLIFGQPVALVLGEIQHLHRVGCQSIPTI